MIMATRTPPPPASDDDRAGAARAERRRQILDAATEVFAEVGYHEASINAIMRPLAPHSFFAVTL